MKKHGEGSARQLENGSWECMVQSKYINPDSKDMSPKRIKRRGKTENDARKKAKQALLVWEKNYEETRLNKKMDKKKTFGQYMDEFIETEVKRCGIGAGGYPHLRFSLSEPVYGREQGGTGREKVRPVLRGHSYYQRNEGCNQWHISSFHCLGERHGSFFIGRPDGF